MPLKRIPATKSRDPVQHVREYKLLLKALSPPSAPFKETRARYVLFPLIIALQQLHHSKIN